MSTSTVIHDGDVICPSCDNVVNELPIPTEPQGGMWICDDCKIAFNKSGRILASKTFNTDSDMNHIVDVFDGDGIAEPTTDSNGLALRVGEMNGIDGAVEEIHSYDEAIDVDELAKELDEGGEEDNE